MKNLNIIFSLILITIFVGCKDFEEYQIDPNRTTEGDPGLLLTGIQISNLQQVTLSAALACRQMVYTDGSSSEQYYGWQRSGFGAYNSLRQVVKMEEEAMKIENTNYIALGKFFRAYIFLRLTNTFGDVPYFDALQGSEGNFTPKYDKQEDIYLSILDDLKAANQLLNEDNGIINGDLVYEGSIENWKKAINSLSLRVLISLSKKEGNTKLNVVNRFKEIVENPSLYPIFNSNQDNLQLPYYNLEGNEYPYFNNNSIKTAYYFDESFVDLLKNYEDPRLFTLADKEENGSDLEETDFNAYGGFDGSALLDVNTGRLANGEGSPIDERYYNDPINEPSIALGYAEVAFTLAEAAARGWINLDPAEQYYKGIEASMKFYGVDNQDIESYLQNAAVQYVPQQGIEMVITQKYISFFMNSGWEPFYNQRRTGFPEFKTNGGGVLNNEIIPKRWMYPQSEINENLNNLETAVNRQFPDGDNVNGEMWLLKQE
ncbi:SusD/RagB family nutrient-binding outer membrane lipoprotein [Zhouia amylolytica]|nr:SusD/RagB family nutrient-binding outer membrane lipoprotein [Zhouia amylolytica]